MNRNLGILSGVGMFGTAVASIFGSEIKSFQDSQRKEWEKREARKFKNRYSSALLNLGDLKLWDSKGTLLRSSGDSVIPTHPVLKEAMKYKLASDIEKFRILHRKGCQDIYESSDRKYFDDFKSHCSRNNEEIIKGEGITHGPTGKSELFGNTNIKELALEFASLQKLMNSQSSNEFDSKLLEICNEQKKNIYMGEQDLVTKNIKSFCIK